MNGHEYRQGDQAQAGAGTRYVEGMYIRVEQPTNFVQERPRLVCPNCRRLVLLEMLGGIGVRTDQNIVSTGTYRCPAADCHQLVIVVTLGGEIVHTFPLNKIEFNIQNIPVKVTSYLEEALTCRANNCYVASAIMLRKTLETLCDELGITGQNLKQRVQQFNTRVTLPPELLAGLDDIRLLGNDAAHVESQTFGDISPNELDLSIEIIKEVLKGLYQYSDLISRLQALKKPAGP